MSATRDPPRLPEGASSPLGKLVVLYVQVHGGSTIERLQRDLELSELSLLVVVERLAERDVLRVDDGEISLAAGR